MLRKTILDCSTHANREELLEAYIDVIRSHFLVIKLLVDPERTLEDSAMEDSDIKEAYDVATKMANLLY
jgi:hypothetical protein|tara:strand:- start:48 stop:254 length:207 start_codon:yes stop_codon:yes gene_type:complete